MSERPASDAGEARTRAAAAYNAASDRFDHPALAFWDRFGRRTVERLALAEGASVLDVCCGTGASALPAARVVGPAGRVLAVDVADRLVALGAAKARAQGLDNVEFRVGDLLELGLVDESFDAVVCVFGIFFVPDLPVGVARLWRLVRPGGALAITTWGPRIFEPAVSAFWAALGAERPDLVQGYQPWNRITDPESLRACLAAGGAPGAVVDAEPGQHAIATAADWWTIVMGSGYRATVERLDPDAAERVRVACSAQLERDQVRSIETNVLYAVARRTTGAGRS
jgi:SAM-dependent methyltransferase